MPLKDKEKRREYEKLLRRRLDGYRGLDNAIYPSHVKGRRSEKVAAEYLRNTGFVGVELIGGPYRPDITFLDNKTLRRVEVKSAIYTRHRRLWYVESVGKNRLSDDYVAIVLPDDSVVFSTMTEHLAQCSPNGRRSVTGLVKSRCPHLHPALSECVKREKIVREKIKSPKRFRARDAVIEILKQRGEWAA